jgi:Lrp/AsnC family transcriptional regulator for asnA, asnC and gidA
VTQLEPDLAQLDELDHALIAALRVDGRVPSRALADRFGVGEGTIGQRIRRLADDRVLRVVAVTDMAAFGYQVLVGAWIEVRGRSAMTVGAQLAGIPEVASVTVTVGAHDLFATVVARDHGHLGELVHRIKAIPGIARIDWELALDVLVYRSEWGILSQDGHPPLPRPGLGVDDFDVALIGLLQRDGRASNRRLAAEFGVSEAMIRARIRRMECAGAVRIVAVTDVAAYGMSGFAVAGVHTSPGAAADVATALAGHPALPFVATTLGPHNVLVSVVVHDRAEMLDIVLDQIPGTPGVARVDAAEGQMVLKHSFSWVRLTEDSSVGNPAAGLQGRARGQPNGRADRRRASQPSKLSRK